MRKMNSDFSDFLKKSQKKFQPIKEQVERLKRRFPDGNYPEDVRNLVALVDDVEKTISLGHRATILMEDDDSDLEELLDIADDIKNGSSPKGEVS